MRAGGDGGMRGPGDARGYRPPSGADGTPARKKRESEVRSAKRKDRHDEWKRVFGTEKRFSGVRVQVLGGFELNDEK